ncbi:MAG: pyridoxal-phosphate dependent enzyme [Gammaproteobacteria bacterium]|nr:pyridoxal-phosphate dependent enzyme [Gammaproteobacteria bacterium]
MTQAITLRDVQATARLIQSYIRRTPVADWVGLQLMKVLPEGTTVVAKLEIFQHSGTFKARGALSNILRLTDRQKANGITAMSAGNHAVAVAYAAAAAGVDAKLVMQSSANPARIEMARSFGARLLIAEDGPTGFAMAEEIAKNENRAFIHPFDGADTARGTATLGQEFNEQVGDVDVLIIAIGGGALAGGVSAVTKLLNPNCHIIGVEPFGADSMYRSFKSGKAETIGVPKTIADSLGPPMTLPYPFELCRNNVDDIVRVTDEELKEAMRLIFNDLKLAVEPACAATTAALLKVALSHAGKRIGIVLCGSNIDWQTYRSYVDDANATSAST